jgi:glycosyltransferase involved in cell wall biosynthesis
MTDIPFFSILLPTKNRSHLVGKAIESVLKQTFDDYELILADNDDDLVATKRVVHAFDDKRIHYFRTGDLSMVDNWEFARLQARGQYVTVLEDKQAYYPWALKNLRDVIDSKRVQVVVWRWDASGKIEQIKAPRIEEYQASKTEGILEQYTTGKHPWARLPRMLNSCVSAELMEYICTKVPEKHFFIYCSPDLCAAFMQLAYTDELMITRKSLGYLHSDESNSSILRKNKSSSKKYFTGEKPYDLMDAVALVPIKNPYIIQNAVYNDFLRVREILGGKLDNYQMSSKAYAQMCLRDLLSTLRLGGSIKTELQSVVAYMRKEFNVWERIRLWGWLPICWFKQKVAPIILLFFEKLLRS